MLKDGQIKLEIAARYLARKIITDEGGYIKVKSTDKGSTFSISLSN